MTRTDLPDPLDGHALRMLWTRYHGPTDRISVHTAGGRSARFGFNHAARDAHQAAVESWLESAHNTWEPAHPVSVHQIGDTPDGRGRVFALVFKIG